jgi:gluconate 2-dehydrogenase gamma chain
MIDRRKFVTILGSTAAAASTVNLSGRAEGRLSHAPGRGLVQTALGTLEKAYTFFTQPEIEFMEAAVDRLIPADELGTGALEADVVYFIDQQLSGGYGHGVRHYLQGPWGAESAYLGYQLPLTPRELYRIGIAATDRYCEETYGKPFARLEVAQQNDVLTGLEAVAGDIDLDDVPGVTFFGLLLRDTKDGFFADPMYGGNKDKVGWKLVGFPGVAAAYTDFIERYNEPYQVEPVSVREMQQAQVPLDEHGHPRHQRADSREIRRTSPPVLHAKRKQASNSNEGLRPPGIIV